MNSYMTKFAVAAAAIAICVILLLPDAYALDDSIEAHNSIRWLRINHTAVFSENASERREVLLGCDERGQITSMRFELSGSNGIMGPLTVIQKSGRSEAWLSKHNLHVVGYGSATEAVFSYNVYELDPMFLLRRLTEQHAGGEAVVHIDEPEEKEAPIVITVTYPKGSRSENWEKVIYVDQTTNLVRRIEKFERSDSENPYKETLEFSDYNKEIDPGKFTLDGEVSADAKVVDMSGVQIGMFQGDMTDEEIATKLTKAFFEAVIAEDFDRAGRLYLGAPGSLIANAFKGVNAVKILSVGDPHITSNPDSEMMVSSCKVLTEVWSDFYEIDAEAVNVLRVAEAPNSWLICGMAVRSGLALGTMTVSPDGADLDAVTYDGLGPFKLMKKWLVLEPVQIQGQAGADPSEETQKEVFAKDYIDIAQFAPNVSIGGKDHKWSVVECEYGPIDLTQPHEGPYQATYAWAQVNMREKKKGILGIGSNDSVKVWLNGELIHEKWTSRDLEIDSDYVEATFKPGMNQLVLKIQNQTGQWGFCCQLRGDD
ncbi:MAG: hypothetical protein ACYS8Z_13925 [Planctomycetota bacterium]|jgi:hypothetical protein